jgi:hypothetical protein
VNANHSLIVNFFEEELNSPLKGNVEKKFKKEKALCVQNYNHKCFSTFKKDEM